MDYGFSSEGDGEPVGLDEAKAHLRVLHTSEDALISAYIAAASRHVESRIGRNLVNREMTYERDGFPACRGSIVLPRPPVAEITSVSYIDASGAEQTMAPETYILVKSPVECELAPALGVSWPATSKQRRSVTVVYSSGYGEDDSTVPDDIKNAILLLVQHFYEHRSAVTEGSAVVTPLAVEALLGPHMTTGWI